MAGTTLVYLIILSVIKCMSSSESLFDEELYERVLNNVTCNRHLEEINFAQFFDASGRVPQSVSLGGQGSLGNYHQCLNIAQQIPNDTISGKYCMIQVPLDALRPEFNLGPSNHQGSIFESINTGENATEFDESHLLIRTLRATLDGNARAVPSTSSGLAVRVAVCIPKSCTTQETVGQFTTLLNVSYQDRYCRLPNDKVFSAVDYIAVTALHLDAAGISKLVTCCSIYTNTRRLLTFSNTPGSIVCLDGIRALSILWVVIGHSFVNIFLSTLVNLLTAYQWGISLDAIWLTSAVLSVDTFFMMSGLLLVYTTVNKMTSSSLLKNIHWFYLHRLLRMFPLLAVVVLFQASLLHHSGDGPSWPVVAPGVQACRDWWWSALLHVQNYVNVTELCLSQTWYLSVDMQLHIVSPLVLFWVLKGRRSAWCSLAAGLMASLIIVTTYCYARNINVVSLLDTRSDMLNLTDYFKLYYVNLLTRSPPFFVGMVFGYLLHVWREHPISIPKWCIGTGWLAAFALGFGMVFCNYPGNNFTNFWGMFLNSFMRPLWALSVGWVVFACASGYGGPVNWFLSLTMWRFLARVSYSLYLIHFPLQTIVRGQNEMPIMFSVTSSMYTFHTDLALSLMIATLLCVLVDAPCTTLQKILVSGGTTKTPSTLKI